MQNDDAGLRPGEYILTDESEFLWRQINPAFIHDGKVSKQAFTPTPKDTGELSTVRSSKVTAEQSHSHHTAILGLASVGVYSVQVSDVAEVQLRAVDDSAVDDGDERPPGHAFVDFKTVTSSKARQRIGSSLRDKAEARGWQYQAETSTVDEPQADDSAPPEE
ncbi:hypothetical protein [Kitasatospora phosalacinea]|uniref:hypothetical protein n=1 Tax=Kitasatospora phosalacinea TaxID=2065 RepID=UPI00068B949E|nr:hypothetical protein [Kitasatospora phosalacinea]